EIERLLFGGVVSLGLRTPDGERELRAAVQTIGGSGVYARERWCARQVVHAAPDVAADHHERLTITLAYSPAKGAQRCTFAAEDAVDGDTVLRETALSGALVLDLGAFSRSSAQTLHARVRVHGVDLVGLRPVAATSADLAARGRWLLAEGRAEEASELFAQLPDPSPRDRAYQALAWIRRGRWEEAEAALAPLADLDDEALESIAPHFAVAAPSLTPLLQPLLGRRFPSLALSATIIPLLQHADERFARELFLERTPWLGDVEISGPAEQWLKVSLLSRRAAIYRELGDLRRAREDLDAALAAARDEIARGNLSVGPGDSTANRLLFAIAGVYSQQAELYAEDGDLEAARATLARAIAYSPTPELSAARLAERPLLTPLLDELGLLRSASAGDGDDAPR
ncbi:MAG: hypothetical protein KC486_22880, partial [Myxococcales bacterium]|nr:hypothetical protein [Myxococcales bacterium]